MRLLRALLAVFFVVGAQAQKILFEQVPVYFLDPRHYRLLHFFERRRADREAVKAFLKEADEHGLDYRLLPSLAAVESGLGKHMRRQNNWFGWDSGRARFASLEDAIHVVAVNLSSSARYRGKSLAGMLRTYNHHPGYGAMVVRMMNRIGPERESVNEDRDGRHRRGAGAGVDRGSGT